MANTNIQPGAAAAVATGNAPTQAWGVFPAGPPLVPTVPTTLITPQTGRLSISGYRNPPAQSSHNPLTDALIRAAFFRAAGLFELPGVTSLGVSQQPAPALWDSSLPPGGQGQVVSVLGRFNHTVQVSNLDGADSIAVLASVDGISFFVVAALAALTANGLTSFTGAYRALTAVRNSGNGFSTTVTLCSIAP